MAFQVPYSSSPAPSTPDRKSINGNNNSIFFGANPSTTPAGPPPSSAGSFTPAAPPPTSFMGSSMMDTDSPTKTFSIFDMKSSQPVGFARSGLSNGYQPTGQSIFQDHSNDSEEETRVYEDDEDEIHRNDQLDYDEDEEEERDKQNEHEEAMDAQYDDTIDLGDYDPDARALSRPDLQHRISDLLVETPSALRSAERGTDGFRDSTWNYLVQKKPSKYEKIARDMYSRMPIPGLEESDDLILNTENIVIQLYDESLDSGNDKNLLKDVLDTAAVELTSLWAKYHEQTAVYRSEEYATTVGPGPQASKFVKANFLASLALKIYHPPKVSSAFTAREAPLPQVLLKWIEEYHNPYPTQFEEIQAHRPSPSNHHLFWDTVLNCLIRGKVAAVTALIRDAGWRHARSAMDDPRNKPGITEFSDFTLANIERIMNTAVKTLVSCPATHGDWNIRSSDWTLFRLRASQALEDLRSFTEGRNRECRNLDESANDVGSYTRAAKKAESLIPWNLYQNLVTLYTLVMGDINTILANSQDWCEATVGLVAWWDQGKSERRLALDRSQSGLGISSSNRNFEAYEHRLRLSFEAATADSTDFQINSADEVEVALASLFEGEIETVIGFLCSWSCPVSSAVAEVASASGWLPRAEEKSLINMGSLDQDDLDVLGISTSPSKSDGVKDKALINYANRLSERDELVSSVWPGVSKEGWELSLAILGRLDSMERSEELIWEFVGGFTLGDSTTVSKLWNVLNDLGLSRHAARVAESYAEDLAMDSHKYGEAIWHYALAHKSEKVKDVLDLLISYSLVQSTAYPPDVDLDDHLRRLISSPKNTLNQLSRMDIEAAELLQKSLSGYATLRKFYDLRDETLLPPTGKPKTSANTRKSLSASSLITVITSSSDNIRGGLYDEDRGAVVSVDFLLVLLGEAMVFVNQEHFNLTVCQIDVLLRAIEDLQTVTPRVYTACTEFLQTVIASGQGLKGSTPADLLRKSSSNSSGMSSFSMVGSSMLASQLKHSMSQSGLMVQGKVKRGWDWRQGISAGTTAEDVLRILRHGLAKDLARSWLLEVDNIL